MKLFALAFIYISMLAFPLIMEASYQEIEEQIYQLRKLLATSNNIYIYQSNKHCSYYAWLMSWVYPKYLSDHKIVLDESKKIASLIVAMEKIQAFNRKK